MLDRFIPDPGDNVRKEVGIIPYYALQEPCEFETMFGIWFLCYLEKMDHITGYMKDMAKALENDGRIILMEPVLRQDECQTRMHEEEGQKMYIRSTSEI